MLSNLSGWHLLIILAVVLLLFGASRLPALSKGIGQSVRIFKGEMRQADADKPTQPTDVEPERAPDSQPLR